MVGWMRTMSIPRDARRWPASSSVLCHRSDGSSQFGRWSPDLSRSSITSTGHTRALLPVAKSIPSSPDNFRSPVRIMVVTVRRVSSRRFSSRSRSPRRRTTFEARFASQSLVTVHRVTSRRFRFTELVPLSPDNFRSPVRTTLTTVCRVSSRRFSSRPRSLRPTRRAPRTQY